MPGRRRKRRARCGGARAGVHPRSARERARSRASDRQARAQEPRSGGSARLVRPARRPGGGGGGGARGWSCSKPRTTTSCRAGSARCGAAAGTAACSSEPVSLCRGAGAAAAERLRARVLCGEGRPACPCLGAAAGRGRGGGR